MSRRHFQLIAAITSKDIEKGQRRKIGCCPLALSLRRRFPAAEDITADYDDIVVRLKDGTVLRSPCFINAERWMTRFDNLGRKAVKPTRVLLEFMA